MASNSLRFRISTLASPVVARFSHVSHVSGLWQVGKDHGSVSPSSRDSRKASKPATREKREGWSCEQPLARSTSGYTREPPLEPTQPFTARADEERGGRREGKERREVVQGGSAMGGRADETERDRKTMRTSASVLNLKIRCAGTRNDDARRRCRRSRRYAARGRRTPWQPGPQSHYPSSHPACTNVRRSARSSRGF